MCNTQLGHLSIKLDNIYALSSYVNAQRHTHTCLDTQYVPLFSQKQTAALHVMSSLREHPLHPLVRAIFSADQNHEVTKLLLIEH